MGSLSPARALALEVGRQVRLRDAFTSSLVDSIVDASDASPEDRSFATRLALGVAATWGTLDEVIDRSLNKRSDVKPKVRDALRISVYELLFLGKEDRVVVDQGVELVRSIVPKAAGLANAVLRKACADARDFPFGDPSIDDEALARSAGFPVWLTQLLIKRFGREGACAFMEMANEPAPLFLAPNLLRCDLEGLQAFLVEEGIETRVFQDSVLYCPDTSRGVASRALKQGLALVCDASSVASVNLCPAPQGSFLEVGSGRGTKTVLLKGRFHELEAQPAIPFSYTALDKDAFKTQLLTKRLAQLGVEGVSVLTGDARELPEDASYAGAFLDVPCTGLGTLRRHPEIRWKLTSGDIQDLASLSAQILSSVADRIQPGGFLVYSTCTITTEEDEELIAAFLQERKDWELAQERPVGASSLIGNPIPDIHYGALLHRHA